MINMSFLDPQSAVLWTRCYELPFTWKATHPFTLPLSIGPGPIILHEEDGSPLVGRLRPLVNLERRCEQVRKILPCRCSSLRQPRWRHGTLVCLKAHNMTFGFKNNIKATEESWWIQQPLVTTVSGKVISTSHSLVNILERTYQLNDKQKGRRTCLKPQTRRKTSLFPFSWQGQPASPSQQVGLPWTCQGRWHLLAGLISLAWNKNKILISIIHRFFWQSFANLSDHGYIFEFYLFGMPFVKPPSYKGYQAFPAPFSSPSKRATTFHTTHYQGLPCDPIQHAAAIVNDLHLYCHQGF